MRRMRAVHNEPFSGASPTKQPQFRVNLRSGGEKKPFSPFSRSKFAIYSFGKLLALITVHQEENFQIYTTMYPCSKKNSSWSFFFFEEQIC